MPRRGMPLFMWFSCCAFSSSVSRWMRSVMRCSMGSAGFLKSAADAFCPCAVATRNAKTVIATKVRITPALSETKIDCTSALGMRGRDFLRIAPALRSRTLGDGSRRRIMCVGAHCFGDGGHIFFSQALLLRLAEKLFRGRRRRQNDSFASRRFAGITKIFRHQPQEEIHLIRAARHAVGHRGEDAAAGSALFQKLAASRFMPLRSIHARASANEVTCTPQRKLLMSFSCVPLPTGPRCTISLLMTRRTG